MESHLQDTLVAVMGSVFGSGGVVWLIVRAAIAELETKVERRLSEEREWAEKRFQARHV